MTYDRCVRDYLAERIFHTDSFSRASQDQLDLRNQHKCEERVVPRADARNARTTVALIIVEA